jgi:hypothetical protein
MPHPQSSANGSIRSNGSGTGGSAAGQASVVLDGEAVVVRELIETDRTVVALVRDSDDPEAAVHQLLGVGGRVTALTRTTMDSEVVRHAFETMREEIHDGNSAALGELKYTMSGFLDPEDGVLARSLKAGREDLERALGEAVDPDSRRSIVGKVEAALEQRTKAALQQLGQLLDPADEAGPVGRYNAALLKGFRAELSSVRELVVQLSEKIAVQQAERALMERTSIKGGSFNDAVHQTIAAIAARHGDTPEMTNDALGACGNKKGDEVITVDPTDTGGHTARFVLENKTGRLSMAATLRELEEAMANREAQAAIAVFGREEHAPASVPFMHAGCKAIVVFDREELDERLLWLSYCWARWVVRRELASTGEEVDSERVLALVERVARGLDKATPIKACLTGAGRKLEEARRHLDELLADADAALAELRGLLCGSRGLLCGSRGLCPGGGMLESPPGNGDIRLAQH